MSYGRYTPVCWGCGVEISARGPGYCNTCRQEKAIREQGEVIRSAFNSDNRQSRINDYLSELDRFSRRR